jgi:hypothetical protein
MIILSVGVSPTEMEELLLKLENEWLVVLGGFSPAIRYSSDRKNRRLSLLSGLGTRVCAPCNRKNEMLFWPPSPGWSVTLQQRGTRKRSVKA